MKNKNLLSWFALVLGVIIIIGISFVVMKDAPLNLFALHLSVSLLIYALFFVDLLLPWVNWSDRSKSRIASIGLRWFFTCIYTILVIGTMIVCNRVFHVDFSVQLIIHGILLFILVLGMSGALHASDKVASVYKKEETLQSMVSEMRRAVAELKNVAYDFPNLSERIKQEIKDLEEDLRYLSPSDNLEAREIEQEFLQIIHDLSANFIKYSENSDRIMPLLEKAKYILKNRKSIYSL